MTTPAERRRVERRREIDSILALEDDASTFAKATTLASMVEGWIAEAEAAERNATAERIAQAIEDWERVSQDLLPGHSGPWVIEVGHAARIAREEGDPT